MGKINHCDLDVLRCRKIGVLAGGPSSEREVSLKSGKAVFEALIKSGLNAVFMDVNETDFSRAVLASGIDTAFIALHGRFGEDGTVQRMLDEMNIPYPGSGPEASRTALDKLEAKKLFAANGLLTPAYNILTRGGCGTLENIKFPCVVKPRYEGSSIGLSIVDEKEVLDEAVNRAFKYDTDVLVENFIPGRELTVGVLDGEALPIVEIVAAGGVYNFDAKYKLKNTEYIVPAIMDALDYKRAQSAGVLAHKALGCEGFSRVDIRFSEKKEMYVLEVNTIPGFTERSLLPMAAKAAGIGFEELCVRILCGAIAKESVRVSSSDNAE